MTVDRFENVKEIVTMRIRLVKLIIVTVLPCYCEPGRDNFIQ
jgi:hypothetical protein